MAANGHKPVDPLLGRSCRRTQLTHRQAQLTHRLSGALVPARMGAVALFCLHGS